MSNDIEKKYTTAVESIVPHLPEDFIDAHFHMEVTDDVWGGELFYSQKIGTYTYKSEELEDTIEIIREIRESFKSSNQEPFTIITISLKNTGKFSFELDYEDISDFGRASERREAWIEKHLGTDIKIEWK